MNTFRDFRLLFSTAVLFVLGLLAAGPIVPVRADTGPSAPRDSRGLPLWENVVWRDFPIRLELESSARVAELLAVVPIASFSREQVGFRNEPDGSRSVVFEPRVTAAEAVSLTAAGYEFEHLTDVDRAGRKATEEAWAAKTAVPSPLAVPAVLDYYPTYAEVGQILAQLAADHPDICRTFTWGTSVLGRDLYGLVISDDVNNTEPEPEVRLSGTMHGDEPPPMVMLLNLAQYLAENYGQPGYEDVTGIVDGTEIHIMPLHNPDGYVAGTRYNDDWIDLNRNFLEPAGTASALAPENQHFVDYGLGHHFVISENGHTGALVVNYPWDYTPVRAPDDAALILLSLEYSTYNLPMYNGSFTDGITNGFDWYVAYGTAQDWSYYATDCIDLTIEMNNSKWPPASQLEDLWDDNRESFLHFLQAAHYGVHGIVTAAGSGLPLDAVVTVAGNTMPVSTDPQHGDYYKLLATGTYDLTFTAAGYQTLTVTDVGTVWGTPTVLDVVLTPESSAAELPASQAPMVRAWPNPFNARTMVRFVNPEPGAVRLTIHDLAGRLVRTLVQEDRPAGEQTVAWNGWTNGGGAAASGVYFLRLRTPGGRTATGKLILAK